MRCRVSNSWKLPSLKAISKQLSTRGLLILSFKIAKLRYRAPGFGEREEKFLLLNNSQKTVN